MMKKTFALLSLTTGCLLVCSLSTHAAPFEHVLFEDDFSGAELKEEWGSWKSATVTRDGVMVGITPKDADHPSVNSLKLPPLGDMEVELSFHFAGSNRFNVMFRDLDYKGAHAGHICHVSISDKGVTIFDGKTGIFANQYYDKKKAGGKYTDEEKAALATTKAVYKAEIDPEPWHKLLIRIEGDLLTVWIDGESVGTLKSEGIGHASKSNMNITTIEREVHYDDFAIRVPKG